MEGKFLKVLTAPLSFQQTPVRFDAQHPPASPHILPQDLPHTLQCVPYMLRRVLPFTPQQRFAPDSQGRLGVWRYLSPPLLPGCHALGCVSSHGLLSTEVTAFVWGRLPAVAVDSGGFAAATGCLPGRSACCGPSRLSIGTPTPTAAPALLAVDSMRASPAVHSSLL